MSKFDITNVKKGTVVRTIMAAAVIVNYVLKATGHNVITIDETEVGSIVETAITVITFIIVYWKNNSWTTAAQLADKKLQELKKE